MLSFAPSPVTIGSRSNSPMPATRMLAAAVSQKATVTVWSAVSLRPAPRLRAMSEAAPVPIMLDTATMTIITG